MERWERVVVDQWDEETKGRERYLAIIFNQPNHNADRVLPGNLIYHLLPIENQVVLIHSLYQNRAQILNNRSTVRSSSFALVFYPLKN